METHGWLKQRVCVEQSGSIDLLRSHPLEEHHFDSWWKPAAQRQNFLSTAKGQAFKPAYTAIFWLFCYLLYSLDSTVMEMLQIYTSFQEIL